jgi:hypothetical protein
MNVIRFLLPVLIMGTVFILFTIGVYYLVLSKPGQSCTATDVNLDDRNYIIEGLTEGTYSRIKLIDVEVGTAYTFTYMGRLCEGKHRFTKGDVIRLTTDITAINKCNAIYRFPHLKSEICYGVETKVPSHR